MRIRMEFLSKILKALLVLGLLAVVAGMAVAQTSATSGALQGLVRDPKGAAVPDAKVTLLNASLGIQRVGTTTSEGTYIFPLLQPASGYEVDVELAGFKKAAVKDLSVRITEVTTANVTLALGEVTQEVVVTEGAVAPETANPTLGSTLTPNVVTSIPLPTRDVLDLLATDAGVAAVLTSPAATILQGSEAIFVGGNRSTSNNYMVNGVDANNFEFHTLANGIVPVPNPDAVQEFRTETSLYDATTGFSGGGNIALVTRSGTSHLHGTAYEFLRNTDMNANDFFFNQNGIPRPVMQQNQFGGSIGGPVPKSSKTYWFFNYEGQRQRNGISGGISGLIPILPAQRTAASMAALYDLPVNSIDPVAINVLNAKGPYGGLLFPGGNVIPGVQGSDQPGELGSFAFSAPVRIDSNQYNARIDHTFNIGDVSNQLSVSYFANPDTFTNTGGANGGQLGQPYDYPLTNNTFSFHDVQTLRSDLLNEITVGFTYNKRDIAAINPVTIGDLGITRFNSSVITRGPNFEFSDQLNCCGASASVGQTQRNESQDFRDMVSYVHGRHTFRTGFEARTQQFNFGAPLDPGTLFFAGGIADGLYGPPTDPYADLSIRDFLIGAPFTASIGSGLTDFQYRAHDFAVFAQDDYRVTSRLTLNLGLRWDYLGNITEKHGRISNFDSSLLTPLAAEMGGPGLQAGFVIPASAGQFGTPGVSNSTYLNQPMKNFGPRIGFGYDVLGDGKLALRGGYGLYYSRIGPFESLQTISNPPFALSTVIVNSGTAAQEMANPFPTLPLPSAFPVYTPLPQLTSLNSDGSPNFTQPQLYVSALQRTSRAPYTEQWNLTTEYEFLAGWMLEVGYMASRGVHLEDAQTLSNALLRNANNPGPFGLDVNSAQNRESRVPVMGINSSGLFEFTDAGASYYDALLLTVSHQFSHGLYLKAAYTFSKAIDNVQSQFGFEPTVGATGNQYLPYLNKGLSNFDVPHRFVLTYVYNLPGLKSGFLVPVVNNWSFSGITTLQSGFAGEVDQFTNLSFSGTDGYGVVVPNCQLVTGGDVSDHTKNYLNRSCATTTTALSPGQTFGPLSPFEGPGNQTYTVDPNNPNAIGYLQGRPTRGAYFDPFQTRWDMALTKTFPFAHWGEGRSLQFRAEAFKVFNTPIFSGPQSYVPFSSFGKITSTIDQTGRQLQVALRLNF
jgi:hypothetical protein